MADTEFWDEEGSMGSTSDLTRGKRKMSENHPRYRIHYAHQVFQQNCAAYVLTVQPRELVMKPGETCHHVGGDFVVAPIEWSEDKRSVTVTDKCAGCGKILKFRQTMDGPWERI